MAIKFTCPVCKTAYAVPDADAGKKDQCKKCGQRIQVPTAPPQLKTVLGDFIPPGAEPPKEVHWTKLAPTPTAPPTAVPKPAPASVPEPAKLESAAREEPAPPERRSESDEEREPRRRERERDDRDERDYDRPERRPRRRRPMPIVNLLMIIATGLWLIGMPLVGCMMMVTSSPGERVGGGQVVVQRSNGRVDVMDESSHNAGMTGAACSIGFCCPTTFYALAMTALLVIRSAMKDK